MLYSGCPRPGCCKRVFNLNKELKHKLDRFKGIEVPFHGGAAGGDGILDLSISVNPFKLPDTVKSAYERAFALIGRYPDPESLDLISAISDFSGLPKARLLAAGGSAEAFGLAAAVFLGDGSSALVVEPSYSDYEHVSRLYGAKIFKISLKAEDGFKLKEDLLISKVKKYRPDLIWLCSPNNPTGVVIPSGVIKAVCAAAGEYGGIVVLDEAYYAFYAQGTDLLTGSFRPDESSSIQNLIVIRSMTKDFGIPGLRLGWVSADPEIIRVMNIHKPSWSVSTQAQAAGISLLNELPYFRKTWKELIALKEGLEYDLAKAGIEIVSENRCGAFVFFKKPEPMGGDDFIAAMKKRGIIIRDCSSMGAPGFCRAGVRLGPDNLRFTAAVEEFFNE